LDRIIEIEPTNSTALFLKGKLLHKLENYEEAISYLEEAIKMEGGEDEENPQKANSFFYLGMCHEKMKDFKQSMMC
jgi:tetratricopeptide (TPR) repeat protein